MCCSMGQHQEFQRWGVQSACLCGCDFPLNYRSRFLTREKRIAALEQHLERLRDEVKAVEERLEQLHKES